MVDFGSAEKGKAKEADQADQMNSTRVLAPDGMLDSGDSETADGKITRTYMLRPQTGGAVCKSSTGQLGLNKGLILGPVRCAVLVGDFRCVMHPEGDWNTYAECVDFTQRKPLNDTNFQHFFLDGPSFEGTNISRSDFRGVSAINVNFSRAKAEGVNFGAPEKKEVCKSWVKAPKAGPVTCRTLSFATATLMYANFYKTDLKDSNFRETSLDYANFSCANLSGADLSEMVISKNRKIKGGQSGFLPTTPEDIKRIFAGATYDSRTKLPPDLSASAPGLVLAGPLQEKECKSVSVKDWMSSWKIP